MSRRERERFLAMQLGWDTEHTRGSQELWEAAVLDLPEAMNEQQLEAWLELVALVSEPSFRGALEQQLDMFNDVSEAQQDSWLEVSSKLMTRAASALAAGESADGELAQTVAQEWLNQLARAMGAWPDASFATGIVQQLEATSDPRFERYWQLVATLKGWPVDGRGARVDNRGARAYAWLLDSVRVWCKRAHERG